MDLSTDFSLVLILIGNVHGQVMGVNGGIRAFNWGRLFFEPGRFTRPKNILWRARLVCSRNVVLLLLPLMVTLPLFLVLTVHAALVGHGYYLLYFYLGVLMPHLKLGDVTQPGIRLFLRWMPKIAARKVAQYCTPEETAKFLTELFFSEDESLEEAAIAGFAVIGPERAFPILLQLQKQRSQHVRSHAKAVHDELANPEFGMQTTPLARREFEIQEYQRWRKVLRTALSKRKAIRWNIAESAVSIDKWVWAQSEINRSFPHVFCKACNSRGEEVSLQDWKWVRCRRCKESGHLLVNVVHVIGQIGGNESRAQDGDRLILSVWDRDTRKPLAADLDRLEIIGGKPIDYDWAVAATVEEMQKLETRQAADFQIVKVEPLALSANTEAILQRLSPR